MVVSRAAPRQPARRRTRNPPASGMTSRDHAPFIAGRQENPMLLTAPQRARAGIRRLPLVDGRHPEAAASEPTPKETHMRSILLSSLAVLTVLAATAAA